MKTIYLKRRIEKFFTDGISEVFALYEDVDGYIHFKNCYADAEKEQLVESQFYKEYREVEG
ncbi:hypothetical protein [Paucisalibacillus globulus]|uniref:hypothetical protein n=1 Tax=Paucisalibacillus globulus TaxID=351095 RepID=UPI000BB8FB87|nr:hypothetical protein [Paucisalibacillus globulus]